MSKTMKKILALLLAAVMMLSLVACGGGGEETQPQGTEGNQTPEETTEATEPFDAMAKYEEPITLTVGRWKSSMDSVDAIGGTLEDNAFWDYVAGELNVNFEYELVYADSLDYEQALDLAVTAGELPDAFVVMGYDAFYEMASEGLLYSLDELIDTYGNDALKNWYAGFDDPWSIATVDGEIMAIPQVADATPVMMIHVRQDWIDKLGLEVDTDGDHLITLEELEMLAREFVANDPGNSGNPSGFVGQASASNLYTSTQVVSQLFGAQEFRWLKNEDGTVTNGILDPGMKDSLAWYADMWSKGLLDDEFGIKTGNGSKMTAGRVGIVVPSNLNGMSWHYKDAYAGQPEMQITTFYLDDGTGHSTYVQVNPQERFLCVSKDCENPEAVIKVLNLIFDLMAETADYDYIDANYPEFKELKYDTTWTPWNVNWSAPGQTMAEAEIYRAIINGEAEADETVGVQKWLKAYLDGDRSADARINYDLAMSYITYADVIKSGKLTVDVYNAPPTTETMTSYTSTLNDLAIEAMVKIVTGEESLDYWDTFVEEWYNRGGQAIIDELEEVWKD